MLIKINGELSYLLTNNGEIAPVPNVTEITTNIEEHLIISSFQELVEGFVDLV